MEPAITGHEAVSTGDLLVHNWRVAQLTRLGVPRPMAEASVYSAAGASQRGPGRMIAAS